jgi:hypothetical protein
MYKISAKNILKVDNIFAIEVKSLQCVQKAAFKHIIDFQHKLSKQVVRIVLYTGEQVLSFGDDVHQRFAVPLAVFF